MTASPEVAHTVSDAELAAQWKRSPDRFTAVYDRYHRAIHRYVAGRLDVAAADDLAAETFLIAFRKRDRFDPERGALRPWLFGIATKLIAEHRRAEIRHYRALARTGVVLAADSHESRVVTSVDAQGMQPALAQALASLTQGERDVLLLLALGDLTHEEIAQALGVSYGTVGSRLSRARKKLRVCLGQEVATDE